MTFLSDMQAGVVHTLEELGTTCTLQSVVGTYSEAGTVSEVVTETTLTCSPLMEEADVLNITDRRLRGAIYVAASGLATAPTTSDRVVFQSRNFKIVAVMPYSAQAGIAAYRLDVAEMGAA